MRASEREAAGCCSPWHVGLTALSSAQCCRLPRGRLACCKADCSRRLPGLFVTHTSWFRAGRPTAGVAVGPADYFYVWSGICAVSQHPSRTRSSATSSRMPSVDSTRSVRVSFRHVPDSSTPRRCLGSSFRQLRSLNPFYLVAASIQSKVTYCLSLICERGGNDDEWG